MAQSEQSTFKLVLVGDGGVGKTVSAIHYTFFGLKTNA
jgi:GTPase SAR1 family protein